MKHVLIGLAIFTTGAFLLPQVAFGALSIPFGGRVTSTFQPNVTCFGGTGPARANEVGLSATGNNSYFFPSYNASGSKRPPSSGGWVLGLYSISFGECWEYKGPYPTPYTPYYRVTLFGVSGY